MATIKGLDRYDGSHRQVTVDNDGPHVVLAVEVTQGATEGVALLTPTQAFNLSEAIQEAADVATASSGMEDLSDQS